MENDFNGTLKAGKTVLLSARKKLPLSTVMRSSRSYCQREDIGWKPGQVITVEYMEENNTLDRKGLDGFLYSFNQFRLFQEFSGQLTNVRYFE